MRDAAGFARQELPLCLFLPAQSMLSSASLFDPEAAKREAEESRRHKLYRNMSCMRDVRKREADAEAMFQPLAETGAPLQMQPEFAFVVCN
jgi:hypothetical protein